MQAELNQTLLTIEREYREVSLSDTSELESENYYLKHKLDTFYSDCKKAIDVCNEVYNDDQSQVYKETWHRIEEKFEDEFAALTKGIDSIETKLYECSARIATLTEIHTSLPQQMRTKYEKEFKTCKDLFLKKKREEDEKLLAKLSEKCESFVELFKMAHDNYIIRSEAADDEMCNTLIDFMRKQMNVKQELIAEQLATGFKCKDALIKLLGEVDKASECVNNDAKQVQTIMDCFIDSICRCIAHNVETRVEAILGYSMSSMFNI